MIDRDIKQFLLKALLAAKETPLSSDQLKSAARGGFPQVAHTEGDLNGYLRDLEEANLIAGTNDEIAGPVWLLTPKGKIRAQALRGVV